MRRLALLVAALVLGCANSAPPAPVSGGGDEVVYLVHNELWSIGLDGTRAHRIATVGDDRRRTGFARRLPDGRSALLADDTGAIYPYVQTDAGFQRLGATNVTLHDALCGVAVAGQPALVYTVTPFVPTHATLMRADLAVRSSTSVTTAAVAAVAAERDGTVIEPSPWEDGAVLAVRNVRGAVTIEILDVGGSSAREVVITVDPPYGAHAPARLPDGRIVFVRTDPRDVTETAIGELFVVERNGTARTTGITGVVALTVVGDQVVYEVGGASGVSDLSRSNLVDAPVNLTRTTQVAEHLGWSD